MITNVKVDLEVSQISYRRAQIDDSYATFYTFEQAIADLNQRMYSQKPTDNNDPNALTMMWEERRSIYEFLATYADEYWVAEKDGEIIGFSRSILEEGLQELTEFFVLPGEQSAGIGRELFRRAFSNKNERYRCIIATLDTRAQARYLKAGLYPRFPIYYFGRIPEPCPINSDLEVSPITATSEILGTLGAIDGDILEHRRDAIHTWLLGNRQGYLYLRDGQPVGYGYIGRRSGPFALLNADDYPAVLAHAETQAAERGEQYFGLEAPMINTYAVDYLLGRGFQMSTFVAVMMSNAPFGKFEQYIVTSPPFFM